MYVRTRVNSHRFHISTKRYILSKFWDNKKY
ncbi:MAG: hypothetical protein KAX69_01230 [Chitinophagales bacterium]|nr:hypothetical protein [Chitinophagales bacterium]